MAQEACTVVALRLTPGQDLKQALVALSQREGIGAACVLTCVGSLSTANLRYAGKSEGATLERPLEILSLVGTLGRGGVHLHLTVADEQGQTLGGHLLDGCLVRTTAELVLGVLPGVIFDREPDPETGYLELVVRSEP
ncbi:PPC domain-containing DNA-binding protein [Armatimonas rosea]|uniref:Putative DNA-binding protein with PD1-like motif n=1 Tax=Armatimonas rosea TaxID=685828 RepID=A0A7W9SRD7_ARMRO|nr:PPC domain-containing DNA-binding protein [Armatimonas rosea]MBB6051397.1 putative DNA-binding protein with PD1-like motif [Armatimonas rosea]